MSEFLHMGGYAGYVWTSVGVFFAVLIWNVVTPRLTRTAVMRRLSEDENVAGEQGD